MDYYVIYNRDTFSIYGLSTFSPPDSSVPEGYVVKPMMGDLPKNFDSWVVESQTFSGEEVTSITRYQFLDRFTVAERIGIRESAKTDPVVNDFMQMLEVSQEVILDNPLVAQGLYYLVYIGKLTTDRVPQLLSKV